MAVQQLAIPHEGNASASYVVSISVGAATTLAVPGGTVGMPVGLLIAADAALCRAKNGGRNQIACTVLLAPGDTSVGSSANGGANI
jgi:PleD family two-component response regulator